MDAKKLSADLILFFMLNVDVHEKELVTGTNLSNAIAVVGAIYCDSQSASHLQSCFHRVARLNVKVTRNDPNFR